MCIMKYFRELELIKEFKRLGQSKQKNNATQTQKPTNQKLNNINEVDSVCGSIWVVPRLFNNRPN